MLPVGCVLTSVHVRGIACLWFCKTNRCGAGYCGISDVGVSPGRQDDVQQVRFALIFVEGRFWCQAQP